MSSNDGFTPAQTKLLCSIIKHLRVPLDTASVDWEAVCAENGHSNTASSQAVWRQLKNKKGLQGGQKKRKNDDEGADAEGGGSPTATKKARSSKGKKGKAGSDAFEDGEANGGGLVKDEPIEDGV